MANWDRVGLALAGFGAGVEGRGQEFLAGIQRQKELEAQKSQLADLAGTNDPGVILKTLGASDPSYLAKYAEYIDRQRNPIGAGSPAVLQVNAAIQKALDSGDYDTANRIAWLTRSQAYGIDTFSPQNNSQVSSMPLTPPQKELSAPMEQVRTGEALPMAAGVNPIAQQQAVNAALKTSAQEQAKADVELTTAPEIERRKAIAKESGIKQGTLKAELGERQATMPQLEDTVEKLSKLGNKATYTLVGQGADIALRQLGMNPGEGAVARKEYISLVDNQILPLLRQTFGAQFTQKEGESLKITLGDPNATPAEKNAVLRSFIDQKKQTINSMERELGMPVTRWDSQLPKGTKTNPDGTLTLPDGRVIRKKQ